MKWEAKPLSKKRSEKLIIDVFNGPPPRNATCITRDWKWAGSSFLHLTFRSIIPNSGSRKMSLSSAAALLLIPLASRAKYKFPSDFAVKKTSSFAVICRSQNTEQQLNLSVLRFTLGISYRLANWSFIVFLFTWNLLVVLLGIPGLDESYLPRYIGYAFGALLVLNHFVGSDSSSTTPAQLVN